MPVQRLASLILLMLSIAHPLAAQPARESDALRLRTLFFQRDYETGVLEGAKLVAANPDSAELKAWLVLNRARRGEEDEALATARQMTTGSPQDAWSCFALAGALHYQGGHVSEAIEAAGKALQMLSKHPDTIWLRGQTMANDPKRREEALPFIESQKSRVKNSAETLAPGSIDVHQGYWSAVFDDGYVDKVGIHSFPTTWFLDRSGRKVFEKEGWSEKLLEEFTWRVEAIRGAPR